LSNAERGLQKEKLALPTFGLKKRRNENKKSGDKKLLLCGKEV
jgi:hypothetical protein